MYLENARRLISELPASAKVLDVGGGASPFPRADVVIDAMPFEGRGVGSHSNVHKHLGMAPRYGKESWVQWDVCDRKPWPFKDKEFDFSVCSHLLEDVRDPFWVCSELMRVSKAGYIETPSRLLEQSLGIENPRYAGYYHHRWLVKKLDEKTLEFRHKSHSLHSLNDAIVARVKPGHEIAPVHSVVWLQWQGAFSASEVLEYSEAKVNDELCAFAREGRLVPKLVVKTPMSFWQRLRRHRYYFKLSRGQR